MEPTGVYYEHLAYHLHKIGQTVYVVLPNKARKFCESEGIRTKTDAMDARSLALMGCANRKLKLQVSVKRIATAKGVREERRGIRRDT